VYWPRVTAVLGTGVGVTMDVGVRLRDCCLYITGSGVYLQSFAHPSSLCLFIKLAEDRQPSTPFRFQENVDEVLVEVRRVFKLPGGKLLVKLPSGDFGTCPARLTPQITELQFVPSHHSLTINFRTLRENARVIAKSVANRSVFPLDGFVYRKDGIDLSVVVRAYNEEAVSSYLTRLQQEQDVTVTEHRSTTDFGVLHAHFKVNPHGNGINREDSKLSIEEEKADDKDWFSRGSDSVKAMYG
jgi:hypothetical protein